jgi:nucleotide-binding universal stress UspA family protein
MDEIKKIMVAMGFSEYCEGLFKYAAKIAERWNANLIVASIINARDVQAVGAIASMGYEVDSENYVSGIKEERQNMLDEILTKLSYPAEKIRVIFKVGNPIDELLKIAHKEDVDLIIMGVKGRTDLEHIMVGSVAEKIFRRSPVPVLSYRDEKNAERLRKRIDLK